MVIGGICFDDNGICLFDERGNVVAVATIGAGLGVIGGDLVAIEVDISARGDAVGLEEEVVVLLRLDGELLSIQPWLVIDGSIAFVFQVVVEKDPVEGFPRVDADLVETADDGAGRGWNYMPLAIVGLAVDGVLDWRQGFEGDGSQLLAGNEAEVCFGEGDPEIHGWR